MGYGRATIEERPVAPEDELPAPSRRAILGLMVALVLYVLVRGFVTAVTRPLGAMNCSP